MKNVYLDNGATTAVDPEVVKAMLPYFTEEYGNASSIHKLGRNAKNAIEQAREHIAKSINAKPSDITFTSGGTESDNLAIKGVAFKNKDKKPTKGPHIITSSIEHPAVLETCKYLEKIGYDVAYLPVDTQGLIDPKTLEETINDNTFLVTIMAANNEIGTIQPIRKLGAICHHYNAFFHTDAVQALGKMPLDVEADNIDMLSISAHKIYGPKGIGALYRQKKVPIQTIQHGGGHEKGLRSSTYNTPGIVGLGKACQLGQTRMSNDNAHMTKLRDQLIKNSLEIEASYLNGHPKKRLANNAHLRFDAIEGESLNLLLDKNGIFAATGSACSSEKLSASHVLMAIGLKPEESHGSLRLTLSRTTTQEDIDYVSEILPGIVQSLRNLSPLWNR